MSYRKPNTLGRNDPCHCGSAKKYKKCHMRQDESFAKQAQEYEHPKLAAINLQISAFKQEILTLTDEALMKKMRALGTTRPETQLDELLCNPELKYLSGVELYSELEGHESIDGPHGLAKWTRLEEAQLTALIHEYARRHYPELPHYLEAFDEFDALREAFEMQDSPAKRREALSKLLYFILDLLPDRVGSFEDAKLFEMDFEIDLAWFIDTFMELCTHASLFASVRRLLFERIAQAFHKEEALIALMHERGYM